jgi:hypothetical protein
MKATWHAGFFGSGNLQSTFQINSVFTCSQLIPDPMSNRNANPEAYET